MDLREVVNALAYLLRAGLAWRLLPHDFPPWQAVYTRFRLWRIDGTWERVHARLRDEVRIEVGHPTEPHTGRLDSQTVKTTHRGGDRGYDGGEIQGRKRFVVVDSRGRIFGLCVLPGDHQDRDGGRWLLSQIRHRLPRVQEVIVDSGFSRTFIDRVRRVCRWKVTTTANDGPGVNLHPRRWVVERTFAWLVKYRRLAKDYEYPTETSEAMIYAAMIHRMVRQLQPDQ